MNRLTAYYRDLGFFRARIGRDQDAAAAFIAWIVRLKAQLGVPAKLAAVGWATPRWFPVTWGQVAGPEPAAARA